MVAISVNMTTVWNRKDLDRGYQVTAEKDQSVGRQLQEEDINLYCRFMVDGNSHGLRGHSRSTVDHIMMLCGMMDTVTLMLVFTIRGIIPISLGTLRTKS